MMKTVAVLMLAGVGFFGINAYAEPDEAQTEGMPSSVGAKGQKPERGDFKERGRHMMEMIKQKYPDEFAEIEKLRKTNPEQAQEKMKALIEKAKADRKTGMDTPKRGGGKEKMFKGEMKERGQHMQEMAGYIANKYSDELAEIEKLRKTNPEQAKEKMKALIEKAKNEMKVEQEKLKALVDEYKKTKDQGKLDEIKAILGKRLEQNLQNEKNMIDKREKDVAECKARYQKRLENKNKMLEDKLQSITSNSELNW